MDSQIDSILLTFWETKEEMDIFIIQKIKLSQNLWKQQPLLTKNMGVKFVCAITFFGVTSSPHQ
jgi:KaiC/GvpD/RAD55 family RecA-like ATPase